MMRHKVVLQEYGHRTPLKKRRALARSDRRQYSGLTRYRNLVLGGHDRWWTIGQISLEHEWELTQEEDTHEP